MGVPVAVVNARVSDRSLPRYLRFRGLFRGVMRKVDVFLAQSEEDARRLVKIGAPPERVQVGGNLKFEVKPPAKTPIVEAVRGGAPAERRSGPCWWSAARWKVKRRCCWSASSGCTRQYPAALMVLAPRHPERFAAVAALLEASGVRWQRRSSWEGESLRQGSVFLLDTIGELASLYQFADLAFVGGSLVPKGGHNVLEAAQFGAAILVGPHTENFRDIVGIFQRAEALRVVTPESLATTVLALLQNDAEREHLGRRALEVMQTQQGSDGENGRGADEVAARRVAYLPLRQLPSRGKRESAERAVRRWRRPSQSPVRQRHVAHAQVAGARGEHWQHLSRRRRAKRRSSSCWASC